MQVLIVEDDSFSQEIVGAILEDQGYDVIYANDGEEAWRIFQTSPVRLVVSDWLMPNMDGLELCRHIRAQDDTDYTYFILITANAGQRDRYFEAMNVGVDDFLSKPLDRSDLEVRIRVAERILKATSRIRSLENVLTICAYTKKVEMPDEGWETIEEFLHKHLGISVSHGISPDHYEKVIKPQLEAMKQARTPPPMNLDPGGRLD